ncbi:hypothetical protein [Mycobacteroides abscessus]|uniref:hypothetical protein n=1 Tax=Mycobacteroides abscessus TaxID=36809 RepID=UPI0009A82FE7|nr:hypothetical protein [Mycobacteroides abscessus]SKG26900.1 Uncharacterised protein [Mycobacteroides abscessus subsp. massiliense]SKH58399.1 Uncharacterised protein [Mycobacteroides abscessus subsp. massiliense]SKH70327.1 Uncharacterised protein [Mycobacteroides abscessus subsp. massiliense]SKI42110.1 Uncharacterised protein [Mycobacteroides abscessus subsp. massiliense]SKI80101.1 Uncharacterised protein [Mycobacteroides abscessus subsp. massiliense]
MTTERRVIFVPDDYWTNPPKENTVSINPHHAADLRRAGVFIKHHLNGDETGVNVVLQEVNEAGRTGPFAHALLVTLAVVSKRLLTEVGMHAFGEGLATVADAHYDPGNMIPEHWRRAARLAIAYEHGDHDQTAQVVWETSNITPTLLGLIDLHTMLIPSISTTTGMQIVDNGISTLVGIEAEGH